MLISLTACTNAPENSDSQDSSSSQTSGSQAATAEQSDSESQTAESTAQPIPSIMNSGADETAAAAAPAAGFEDLTITFGDFLAKYKYALWQNGYTDDTDGEKADEIKSLRQQTIDELIDDRIVRAKFAEYDLALSDEEKQDIESSVSYGISQILRSLRTAISAADESLTDNELTDQAAQHFSQVLSGCGLSRDDLYSWEETTAMKQKLLEAVSSDVECTDEEARQTMNETIDSLKALYESDPANYSGQYYMSVWVPDGSRMVQAILIGFDSDTYSQITSLRSTSDEEADKLREQSLPSLQERYDNIMSLIDSGSDFSQLMTDYNDDLGNGNFLITPGMQAYGTDFYDCAMGLSSPGDTATCIMDYGYYIVRYDRDVVITDEQLEQNVEAFRQVISDEKKTEYFNTEYESWKTGYAFETDAQLLGLE